TQEGERVDENVVVLLAPQSTYESHMKASRLEVDRTLFGRRLIPGSQVNTVGDVVDPGGLDPDPPDDLPGDGLGVRSHGIAAGINQTLDPQVCRVCVAELAPLACNEDGPPVARKRAGREVPIEARRGKESVDHVRRVDHERATDPEDQTGVQAKGAREPHNGDASLGEPGAEEVKDLVHDERDAQLRAPAEPQRDLNGLALSAPGSQAI